MYYYKVSGCLNKELSEYIAKKGLNPVKKITGEELKQVEKVKPDLSDRGNMSFEMNADVFDSLQSASLTAACYDDDEEIFIYLGEDDYVDVSADGKVRSNFNGKWPT